MELDRIKLRWARCPHIPEHIITETGIIYKIEGTQSIPVKMNDANGYLRYKEKLVSHLVLEAFIGPRPFPEACALHYPDTNPHNNNVHNLRWGTHTENMRDKNHDNPDMVDTIIVVCQKCLRQEPCTDHPWVANLSVAIKQVDKTEIRRPFYPQRPGRKGVDDCAITKEKKVAVAEYHLSEAKPTYKETARKFGVSERSVRRYCTEYTLGLHKATRLD